MAGKKVLPQFQFITNQSMTSSYTSGVINVQNLDNIAIELDWSGTPVGTFNVQGSVSYNQDAEHNVLNVGTWNNIVLNPQPAAAGSAGSWLIDGNQFSYPWIRITYTAGSSTGTLNAWVAGKAI